MNIWKDISENILEFLQNIDCQKSIARYWLAFLLKLAFSMNASYKEHNLPYEVA